MNMLEESALSFYIKSIPQMNIAILASSQEKDKLFNTTEYQDAVSSLCYHSFELFLKFAILSKCKNESEFSESLKKFSHDLADLYEQYRNLYPSKEFHIEYPFDFNPENYTPSELNPNEQELFDKHIRKYPPKFLSQNLKYPFDKKANLTNGAYNFKLTKEYLLDFKSRLETIFNEISKSLK